MLMVIKIIPPGEIYKKAQLRKGLRFFFAIDHYLQQ